jgi:hypothetical protein
MKFAWSIGIAFIAWGFAAAGEESPHEQAIVKMLGSLDKISATLKKIVDEESALAAKPELRKEAAIWVEARAKARKLQPPEKAEKVRLEKMYKLKVEESLKKLFTEKTRVELIEPGGKDALKEIAGVFKKDEK